METGSGRYSVILLFLCINMLAVWLFSPNQGTVIYGTKTELLHLFGNHNITKEQLFYQFNIMLKYLTVTPVVLMFSVTTNPSEFAAALNAWVSATTWATPLPSRALHPGRTV